MGDVAEPTRAASAERTWWRHAVGVLYRPRDTFVALRDDSEPTASARAEPVLALVLLAGIGAILGTNASARILDDFDVDATLVAVWAFLSGALYGLAGYWLIGALVLAGIRMAGGGSSYRRARHVLAFAVAPLALTLAIWPLRIALHGEDAFKSGGADTGAANTVFEAVELLAVLWATALLVAGIRTVESLGWGRAAAAAAFAALVPAISLGVAFGVL